MSNLHKIATVTVLILYLVGCGGGGGGGSDSGEPVFVLKRPNNYVPRNGYGNAGGTAEGAAVVDANADGLPDIMRAPTFNLGLHALYDLPLEIYLNLGGGRFVESANSLINPVPTTGSINHPTLIADFNNDGHDDLFLVDFGLEIPNVHNPTQPGLLLSNGAGGLIDASSTNLPAIVDLHHHGSVGDVDNDGDLDILVATLGDIRIYLLINDGSGMFTLEASVFPATVYPPAFDAGSAQLADVNNDGLLDAVIGSYVNSLDTISIAILLQSQTGQFLENQRIPIRDDLGDGGFPQIVAEDMDGDNDIDLITLTELFGRRGLMALRNDGGNFVDVTREWFGKYRYLDSFPEGEVDITGLEIHDFNNDGIPDLSFALYGMILSKLNQYLLINDGTGHLSPTTSASIDSPISLTSPMYIDYDLDGDIDIVGFSRDLRVLVPDEVVEIGYEIIVLENVMR